MFKMKLKKTRALWDQHFTGVKKNKTQLSTQATPPGFDGVVQTGQNERGVKRRAENFNPPNRPKMPIFLVAG